MGLSAGEWIYIIGIWTIAIICGAIAMGGHPPIRDKKPKKERTMRKPKTYSTNIFGRNIIVKAYSMQQIADWLEQSLYSLRPFIAVCGPAVQEPDVDLTAGWPDWKESDWFRGR